MLSWSSAKNGERADLSAVAAGVDGVGLDHGDVLVRFASAAAGDDEAELSASRAALVAEIDEAFMVDAAAVAANFEMMTRLADGTGAAMPSAAVESQMKISEAYGVADAMSRR
jgi:hypothetical protein